MRKQRWKSRTNRKKNITTKINAALSAVILVILLPVFFTILYQKLQLEDVIGRGGQETAEDVEEALVGIVAREISINQPEACIKAQAVIARTNLLSAKQNQTAEPEAFTADEMQELWGEEYASVYETLKLLIQETAGETLKYNGQYIYAAYHSISAGSTRNMLELYPDSGMPYLAAAACHEDTAAAGYLSVNCWSSEDFFELCREKLGTDEIKGMDDIQILARDSAGYVLKVQAGQTVYDGEEFRNRMGWDSSHFSLTELDGTIRVITMGLGHGFGLSQYTAGIMAKDGKNYREILQYFYPGAEITE